MVYASWSQLVLLLGMGAERGEMWRWIDRMDMTFQTSDTVREFQVWKEWQNRQKVLEEFDKTNAIIDLGVSKNSGTPTRSSILIGFSIINYPFWGTPIFGNTHFVHSI